MLQNTPCRQVQVRSIVQGFFASVEALLTKEATNQTESQQIKPNQKGEKSLRTEKRTNKISPCMTAGQEIELRRIGGRRVLSPLPQPCSPYATVCCSRLMCTMSVFFPPALLPIQFSLHLYSYFFIFILVGQKKNQSLQMLH